METTRFTQTHISDAVLRSLSLLTIATGISLKANPVTPLSPAGLDPSATVITFAGLPVFSHPTSVDGVGFVLANGSGPDVAFDPAPLRQFGPDEGTIIQNIVSGFLDLNINFPRQIQQLGLTCALFLPRSLI
jgi:hypothetical protein